jgi:hypothetical protein
VPQGVLDTVTREINRFQASACMVSVLRFSMGVRSVYRESGR